MKLCSYTSHKLVEPSQKDNDDNNSRYQCLHMPTEQQMVASHFIRILSAVIQPLFVFERGLCILLLLSNLQRTYREYIYDGKYPTSEL